MVLILISIDPATPPTIFEESENEAEKCLNKNCHRKHIKPNYIRNAVHSQLPGVNRIPTTDYVENMDFWPLRPPPCPIFNTFY